VARKDWGECRVGEEEVAGDVEAGDAGLDVNQGQPGLVERGRGEARGERQFCW
jgi:hypothetical protein